jgi:hypothetical protein
VFFSESVALRRGRHSGRSPTIHRRGQFDPPLVPARGVLKAKVGFGTTDVAKFLGRDDAAALMQIRAGDCDDFTTLFAALAGTIGIPTRAVTIAADPSAPHDFSHIYPEAEIYPGMWVALDAARPGADYGVEPPRYFRKRIWSLTGSGFRDVSGVRCTSLNGYAVLGDIDSNVAAQDISAVGQSVANVIAATKGNPWGSFSTPYSPSGIAPAAGYGVPGYSGGPGGATLSFAGSSALWWILGLGAVAYAVSSARRGS